MEQAAFTSICCADSVDVGQALYIHIVENNITFLCLSVFKKTMHMVILGL